MIVFSDDSVYIFIKLKQSVKCAAWRILLSVRMSGFQKIAVFCISFKNVDGGNNI